MVYIVSMYACILYPTDLPLRILGIQVGALIASEAYEHKYPYDWRTKKPTIFRATSQWFASVDGFREDALNAIEEVLYTY